MKYEKFQEILESRQPSLKQICKEMGINYVDSNILFSLIELSKFMGGNKQ